MPPRGGLASRVWGECCFGKNTDFQKLPTHPALLLKKEKTSLRIHVLRILLLFSPPLPSFQIYISISKEGKSTPLSSPLPISLSFATFHLGGALNYEHHLNLVFTATRNSSLVSVFQPHLSPPFLLSFQVFESGLWRDIGFSCEANYDSLCRLTCRMVDTYWYTYWYVYFVYLDSRETIYETCYAMQLFYNNSVCRRLFALCCEKK